MLDKNRVQILLQEREGGERDVVCPLGVADLVNDEYVIEVKPAREWENSLGVLLLVGYFPDRKPRVHLFGSYSQQFREQVEASLGALGITTTWEENRDGFEEIRRLFAIASKHAESFNQGVERLESSQQRTQSQIDQLLEAQSQADWQLASLMEAQGETEQRLESFITESRQAISSHADSLAELKAIFERLEKIMHNLEN